MKKKKGWRKMFKWEKWFNGKSEPGKTMTTVKTPPRKKWPEGWVIEKETVTAEIAPDVFIHLVKQFLSHPGEIAGAGLIEDDVLTWADCPIEGQAAFVTGGLEYAKLLQECYEVKGQGYNTQIHTHPGMSTFWSGTDEGDQIDTCNDVLEPGGVIYFIVFDQLDWCLRKVTMDEDGVGHVYNGHLTLEGQDLLGVLPSYNYTSYYTGGYTGGTTTTPKDKYVRTHPEHYYEGDEVEFPIKQEDGTTKVITGIIDSIADREGEEVFWMNGSDGKLYWLATKYHASLTLLEDPDDYNWWDSEYLGEGKYGYYDADGYWNKKDGDDDEENKTNPYKDWDGDRPVVFDENGAPVFLDDLEEDVL